MSIRALSTSVICLLLFQMPAFSEVIVDGGGRFETLLGVRVGQSGVVFEVTGQGSGCTRKDQFHVERFGEHPVRLILIRDGHFPGDCRRNVVFRQGIAFSFSELGLELGDLLEVVNPIEINNLPKPPNGQPGETSIGPR